MMDFQGKHILIIVENLPVPFDRRVWQEAYTLRENGALVSVICPKMKDYTNSFEVLDGISIYRHHLPVEAKGAAGYLVEYSVALFWEFILSCKIFLKKRFHVIHACNPPDLIFLVAVWFKLFGVKYVFDHHDINPELYLAKYNRKNLFYRMMLIFEKMTFRLADFSIATNESYKEIAIRRGKMDRERVKVIRSGPKLDRLKILPRDSKYLNGRKYLVGYVGVIGEQEGIDLLLESVKYIISVRQDIQFAIIGGGTYLDQTVRMCDSMGICEFVDFYGRVSDELMIAILNSADICVNPDKPTEMNNLSTMNKIMEYMALKKPIVQYDLKEGKYSAGQASLYAKCGDSNDFGDKIMELIDDPVKRASMSAFGYKRVTEELSWDHESIKLINFYNIILYDNNAASLPKNEKD